jgi:hypothetical protein
LKRVYFEAALDSMWAQLFRGKIKGVDQS